MLRMIKRLYNLVRFKYKYHSRYKHTVRQGDTLKSLANEFEVEEWSILYLNRNNPNCGPLIFPYKTIWIPLHKPTRW